MSLAFGLGEDESYTLVLSRQLALSYFDHPPLHQWIAHFAALALGEGQASRLPFVALFAATGWLMFALTRRLFDARAGLVALIALNLTPFFFASPGGWITPDGPLLFGARRRRAGSGAAVLRDAEPARGLGAAGSPPASASASPGCRNTAPCYSRSGSSPFSP